MRISVHLSEGSGRPIIFLHGNSSTKAIWASQVGLAHELGRAVLAPDFPGHGESDDAPSPASTYSFPGYAGIVSALIDSLGWPDVDLIGWSLGGHVALELLAIDPRVNSLLIVGTPPVRLRSESLHEAFYADKDMRLAGKIHFSDADAVAYGMAMMGGPQHLNPALLSRIKRTDGRARQWMFANAMSGVGTDQRASVERINKRLCVVHGQNEPFVRLDYLRSLRYRALWKGAVQVIPGTGHAPHWERPAAFNRILSEFLGLEGAYKTSPVPISGQLQSGIISRDSR